MSEDPIVTTQIEPRILAADIDGTLWIRVEGKGSFKNSPSLKSYIDGRGSGQPSPVIVDLENCPGMDSTFMGALTGIAIELDRRGPGTKVEIVNANTRNVQLLQNLGLDQILSVDTDGSTRADQRQLVSSIFAEGGQQEVPDAALSKEGHAEHVLAAHEALVEANEENVPRFRDVVEYLRQDLEKHRP